MRIRSSDCLTLLSSHKPENTVEIDLGSIPCGESVESLVSGALATVNFPQQVATLYVHYSKSMRFLESTDSAFITAPGAESAIEHLSSALLRVPGLRSSYYMPQSASHGSALLHLENGTVWFPQDDANWYSMDVPESTETDAAENLDVVEDDEYLGDAEEEDEDEDEDEDDDSIWDVFEDPTGPPAKDTGVSGRNKAPLRLRAARADASVGSIAATIERMLALPKGSVLLCGPDRRALRRDATVATLRRRWE